MSFWRRALAGLLIGVGCVLPGVSGGLIAVSFGLYRPMLDALLGFLGDARRNARYLLPLALGGAAGYFIGAVALHYFMREHQSVLLMLFIGLIVGGVPGLVRQANAGGFRWKPLLALALGLGLSLALTLLPAQKAPLAALRLPQALLSGMIQGVGTVVPGVSGSFLLIYLGWYQAYLRAVTTLDIGALLPIAVGFALAALICMRGAKRLFDHAPAYAYYGVLGFLLGTTALIVPPLSAWPGAAWELAALGAGILGALGMRKLEG